MREECDTSAMTFILRPDGEEEAQRCRDNGWNIDDAVRIAEMERSGNRSTRTRICCPCSVGSSGAFLVVDGTMVIGQWQSVLLVDLDGPRDRTVGVQFLGYRSL
jgi:hypothetical protein